MDLRTSNFPSSVAMHPLTSPLPEGLGANNRAPFVEEGTQVCPTGLFAGRTEEDNDVTENRQA